MERILVATFVLAVWLSALLCLLAPERVVAFRKARGWSESIISGGWCYATPSRTRVMGVVLLLITSFGGYFLMFSGR